MQTEQWVLEWSPTQGAYYVETVAEMLSVNQSIHDLDQTGGDYYIPIYAGSEKSVRDMCVEKLAVTSKTRDSYVFGE